MLDGGNEAGIDIKIPAQRKLSKNLKQSLRKSRKSNNRSQQKLETSCYSDVKCLITFAASMWQ